LTKKQDFRSSNNYRSPVYPSDLLNMFHFSNGRENPV
jgi:hypothetical protein